MHIWYHISPNQVAEPFEVSGGDINPGTIDREVKCRRQAEVFQQAITQKFDFCRLIALGVEIAAATITATTAIVHLPDGNTECRDKIGRDIRWNAFDAIGPVKHIEKRIKFFNGRRDKTIMNVNPVGTRVMDLDAPWKRGANIGQLPMFPLDQGLLPVPMIDTQPDVLTVSFQARIAEYRTYDDFSAFLGQTH